MEPPPGEVDLVRSETWMCVTPPSPVGKPPHRPLFTFPLQVGLHEVDLERQRTEVEAIAADAAEESRVNREVAVLVVQRLNDGKRCDTVIGTHG